MRLLVVQTSFLGDVILSSPVLTNLKQLFPDSEISVLTTPAAEPLLKYHPAVSNSLVFDKRGSRRGILGLLKMIREIRAKRFDMVVSLHRSYRTALMLRLSGIPKRIGFSEAKGHRLYTQSVPRLDQTHDVLRNLAILRAFGREPQELDQTVQLGIPHEKREAAVKLLGPGDYTLRVGIAPGSVWATKRWTSSGFARVAEHFIKLGAQIVFIGGPDDQGSAREIARKVSKPTTNLVGQTDLLTAGAVISKLDLLITNDSAPLHLASAVKTPTVAIFCATVPEFGFGPWQTVSESVGVARLSCRPCARHGGESCPTGTNACQLDLTPNFVIEAAERVLKEVKNLSRESAVNFVTPEVR